MKTRKVSKVIFLTMAFLLVFSLGCSNSKDQSSSKNQENAVQTEQVQGRESTSKAKATINKNLDQLDKDLNELDKADSGVENLNENDFN